MTACEKCGAVYTVQKSIETEATVRNICRCESNKSCGGAKRGKQCDPVVQAVLDGKEVREYLCLKHAAQDCIDEPAVSPPKEKRPRAVKKEDLPLYVADDPKETLKRFSEEIKDAQWTVKCKRCGDNRKFKDSVVTIDKFGLPETRCPKCNSEKYDHSGR